VGSEVEHEFGLALKEWLLRQGNSYKRSDLAKSIGITPRHLNRVLQGTRNLSSEAKSRAAAVMGSIDVGDSNLRGWLQKKGLTIADFAIQLGKSQKTIEDWVYKGSIPNSSNRALLYSITGLQIYHSEFAHGKISTIATKKNTAKPIVNEVMEQQTARKAVASFRKLIRNLQELAKGDKNIREQFRHSVPGSDIGYLRSLLAALLDEEQLEDWKRMSSYRPR